MLLFKLLRKEERETNFSWIQYRTRISCKHVCRGYCKKCYVAAYEASICPGPCACHMTSQSHQIHLTTVNTRPQALSLLTNPSKIKPQPFLSLPASPLSLSLSPSLHHRSSPPPSLGSNTINELNSTKPFSLQFLLQKWKKRKEKRKYFQICKFVTQCAMCMHYTQIWLPSGPHKKL